VLELEKAGEFVSGDTGIKAQKTWCIESSW